MIDRYYLIGKDDKMTKQEFSESYQIARSSADLKHADTNIFDGFGLPDYHYPVYVTREQVAKLIRWQCQYIFGDGWDSDNLQEIANIGRTRFQIV